MTSVETTVHSNAIHLSWVARKVFLEHNVGDISAPPTPVINANSKEVRHMTAARTRISHSGAARIYVKLRLLSSRGNARFRVDGNLLFTAIENHMERRVSCMWKTLVPVVRTSPTMRPEGMLEQTAVAGR